MDAGHGVRRDDLMYNDFVIVGPEADPAGIEGMNKAPKALSEIAEAKEAFVSRGDDSGTHTKEKAIWAEAGVEPAGDWYISAGQGMGAVLTMADEQQAYTLSDRATYLARTLEGTELVILVEGDPILFNPYGVMAVNPDKNPQIDNDLANQFVDWLVSVPAQEKIAEFGVDQFGAPLFTPDSAAWREAQGSTEQPAGDAALKVTGKVDQVMSWAEEEVKAMETMDAESTNKAGETKTYTGVSINNLLEMAGPAAEATTVVYVAADGSTAEVTLTEVQDCADCIVSFRNQGGFSIVMPGFPGNVQVKGVIEIQVK
jgi:predicted  nucleic acid-binding Zn-ribbon protein